MRTPEPSTPSAPGGFKPNLHIIDNKTSADLFAYLEQAEITVQMVPPHCHRRNAAERAIRTFKNHLIAALCTTDDGFPLDLWDKILEQVVLTLNLMRASRMNPRLSAHAQVHGAFDYNLTPLAPPGTLVLVHEKPSARGTW